MGGFALGETDPRAGERKGLESNSRFDLEATASIPDLRHFLADPQHTGELTGVVRFGPLGDLEIHSGVIRLFRRTGDRNLKIMEYCFGLRHGAQIYYLAGQKEIRRRRLLHSWSETTTLLCRLHEASDTNGPVVGAGVLHLTPREFLKQLSTFQVTEAPAGTAKAGALLRFVCFFAAELLDSYV